MYKLVLVRHGQSTWNLENRFTGWTDVGLTDLGREEAHEAGKLLRGRRLCFRRGIHLCVAPRHSNPLDRLAGNESRMDPCHERLAAQ